MNPTLIPDVPLFPLRAVLFPGGPLPLRVFEPRYLKMVSRCLREDRHFGVVLIRQGNETDPEEIYKLGTLARIVDWYQGSDSILGITVLGEDRFFAVETQVQDDGLFVGTIQKLPMSRDVELPNKYQSLADMLESVLQSVSSQYAALETHFDDAGWVGTRLAELLPIALEQKQECLEIADPIERLGLIKPLLKNLRIEVAH